MYNFTKLLFTITLFFCMGSYVIIRTFNQENNDAIEVSRATKPKIIMDKISSEIQKLISSYSPLSGVPNLEEFAVEPLRVIIISPWGFGSKYLGQLFKSIPDIYYHYEPLSSDGVQKLSPSEVKKSIRVVKKLLKCNYEGLKDYLLYVKNSLGSISNNSQKLWTLCKFDRHICYTASFISQFCKMFPLQVMKVVRLRLEHMINILNDSKLNVKMILLVRDPRDVIQARQTHQLCQDTPDCLNPLHICGDMISNHVILDTLRIDKLSRVMVLRYETLAQHTEVITQRILRFLNVNQSNSLDQFEKSHTELETLIPGDMINNSSGIHNIQVCKIAMKLWNYKIVKRKPELKKSQTDDLTIEFF